MTSIRKDTAVSRAALARRRQRVVPSSGKVQFQQEQQQQQQETLSTDSSSRRAPSRQSEPKTATATISATTPPPKSSVLERSQEVSEQVASVLASVRKASPARHAPSSTTTADAATTTSSSSSLRQKTSLERSQEVAQQAASVLASVRRSTRPAPLAQGDEESSPRHPLPPSTPTSNEPTTDDYIVGRIELTQEEEEEDLPPTIEDLEPRVCNPVLDAACLPDQSLLMLRSNANLRTLVLLDDRPKEAATTSPTADTTVCTMSGHGLGQTLELWKLTILESRQDLQDDKQDNKVLCYGDRIALHQGKSAVLSVEYKQQQYKVGFFGSQSGLEAQWQVLRAQPPHAVRVGKQAPTKHYRHITTGPVRAGDPIVLRNVATGGVLMTTTTNSADSNQPNGAALRLRTDSYDSNHIRHDETQDGTLLGRLQRQDRLVPAVAETFHWLPATVPPTPLWVGQRPFSQGSSYLLLQKESNASNASAQDYGGWGAVQFSEEMHKPFGQEQVLLDELLGSFLGLEGDFVVAGPSGGIDSLSFTLIDSLEGPSFDIILRKLVEDMLPLSASYARVRHFVAKRIMPGYEYGCVMHAFCERLDLFLHDYVTFIVSLERKYRQGQCTSLCSLQVQVQATMNAMKVMDRAIQTVVSKKGGALLNALWALKRDFYEGDNVASVILEQLLETASGPYLKILGEWLESGMLLDPYSEFMVRYHGGDLSEKQYELSADHVLEGFFSNKLTVEKVLATGRYWKALQACEIVDSETKIPIVQGNVLRYSENSATVASLVETNYQKASRALVDLLLDSFDLIGSLRMMKRYFLLDHGDFFIYFLDAAEEELCKDLSLVSRGRIQHWLDASIQRTERQAEEVPVYPPKNRRTGQQLKTSGLLCRFALDSLADHLDELHAASGGIDTHEPWTPQRHAYKNASTTIENLSGLDAFMVDFEAIPFPLSLILTPKSLDCYQLLFRHLFFAKHVERRLVGIWQDHQDMKELQSLRKVMGPTFLLRQRMLHFVQNLIYYMMLEVIEPNWSEMENSINDPAKRKDQTIDDIYNDHMKFLHRALEACLLTNRDLVRSLTKLMKTCLLFSDQMKLFMKATKIEDDRKGVANEKRKVVQRHLHDRSGLSRRSMDRAVLQQSIKDSRLERKERIQRQTSRVEREIRGESYPRMITRFDEVFSNNLREFMALLTHSDDLYHTQKVNLCIRLDYNGYVTRAIGLTSDL